MKNLDEIRNKINEIDSELVPLFLERMSCSAEVAEVKMAQGLPVLNQAREDEIIKRLTKDLGSEEALAVKELYLKIFEISRNRQTELIDKEGK